MGRRIVSVLLALAGLANYWSCARSESPFDPNTYVAHLNMGSYVILATEIAHDMDVPWDIAAGPDGWIWYTEQRGIIGRVQEQSGEKQVLAEIRDVFYRKSTGLFSMALHPDFARQPYVYVHYTYATKDADLIDHISSRVVRLTFRDNKLTDRLVILDDIPGNTFHNGSRMLISDDGKLYLGCGDAGGGSGLTQNTRVMNGKILRINIDGSIPDDNPFPGSPVWSTGHRNVQGITMGHRKLYASEHGPNNDDEVNIIVKGRNYGWPDVEGFCDLDSEKGYCRDSMVVEPIRAWTPTIATSDLLYYDDPAIPEWQNSLVLGSLKGQSLRLLELNKEGTEILEEHILFQKFFGRIRAVAQGKNGSVYITTSNRDWHPLSQPWMYDSLPLERGDRILKLEKADKAILAGLDKLEHPVELREAPSAFDLPTENFAFNATDDELNAGQELYTTHCAACHRANGKGNEGFIPPLVQSQWVSGNTARLIDITLGGLNTEIEVNGTVYQDEMPAYRHLKDEEIADILNYVRVAFGRVKGNIIAADVHHQRKGLP